jgi:hypothetical protein
VLNEPQSRIKYVQWDRGDWLQCILSMGQLGKEYCIAGMRNVMSDLFDTTAPN